MISAKKLAAKIKTTKSNITTAQLYTWNKWLAVVYAVQGVALLILSTSKTFPLTTNYLTTDALATESSGETVFSVATRHLADVNMVHLVAVFLFIAAIAHAVIALWYKQRYEADLKKGVNKARWIEHGLSAGVMLVAIGLLNGVSDLSALLMLFAFNIVMNLLGLAAELYGNAKNNHNCLVYWAGGIAGIVPWIVFAIYLVGANMHGDGALPAFLYWIYATMLAYFVGNAVVVLLRYKKYGKWADYLYGERVYMVVGLLAKTALAWQIFAGILRP